MPRRFLFLLSSARRGGNTERLARLAAESLPGGAEAQWLDLSALPLEPFTDLRHGGSFAMPTGHGRALLDATLWATDLVFVAPTYWYSLPAPAKLYLDHWTGWMRLPGIDFKAKLAGRTVWVVTVNSDDAGVASSEPVIDTLRRSAEYLAMRFGGALVGHGNRPGDIEQDAAALESAKGFFRSPAA